MIFSNVYNSFKALKITNLFLFVKPDTHIQKAFFYTFEKITPRHKQSVWGKLPRAK